MKAKSRFFAASVLALAFAGGAFPGSAFAEGAGGPLFGLVMPAWNPSFMPEVPSSLPEFEYMGGYGYGLSRDDVIIGGFGLAFLDYNIYASENWGGGSLIPMHVAGGAGGLVVGSRVIAAPGLHLDLAARLGLGGMGLARRELAASYLGSDFYRYATKGYAIVYAEPYAELGLGLTPWMRLCATLSYPLIGNFLPGKPFSEVFYYTPAIGLTVSFGKF